MEAVLVPIIVAAIGGFFAWLRQYTQVKYGPQKVAEVYNLARIVVAAANEIGRATGITGADKYEYAKTALPTLARRVGLNLKPEEVNAIINSLVGELKGLESQRESENAALEAYLAAADVRDEADLQAALAQQFAPAAPTLTLLKNDDA